MKALLVVLLLAARPLSLPAQFSWTTNDDQTITITGYTGSETDLTIPDSITGLPVTTIGPQAFIYASSLMNVTISDNVTTLGDGVFLYCANLTSVKIGAHTSSIGNSAFANCPQLIDFTIDPANSTYATLDGVLFDKTLTTLTCFPAGFRGSYVIPDSVSRIGYGAFYSCSGLTGIGIPDSVTNIEENAFYGCTALGDVPIPDSVTTIAHGAFFGCSSITNLTIPRNLATIDKFAFAYCSELADLTLSNQVTNINLGAFYYCTNLAYLTVGSSVTNIGDGALFGCNRLTNIFFLGNAPALGRGVLPSVLGTIYYLPGTKGWKASFGSWPTVVWLPTLTSPDNHFGLGTPTNFFGFTISWAPTNVIVVEVSSDLRHWTPMTTNALTTGTTSFSDPAWTNYPRRFYRVRTP